MVQTGKMHNYLRMLWGKKVLEWSPSPAEAYRTLEHLNNKYALDGRNPKVGKGCEKRLPGAMEGSCIGR